MALQTRSNAGSLLGGNAMKENEMLARAGIKPRPVGLGAQPQRRPALGNLSNRNPAKPPAAGAGKPAALLKEKENVGTFKPRLLKTTATSSLQSKLQPQKAEKQAPAVVDKALEQLRESPEKMNISGCASPGGAFSHHFQELPEGIQNIDTEDLDNPQLVAEYVQDIYQYMRHLEEKYSVRQQYLEGSDLTPRMRGILIDWLVQVHLRFHLLQETLYLTVAIIDRFLQVQSVKRDKLQLVGVTAMLVASKYEEMYAPEIADFVYITDNAYTKQEIRRMECVILKTLDFNLGRPLPLHFLRRNSKAGEVDAATHSIAKYLMELTILDYNMAHRPPSIIAAAALCLAMKLEDIGDWSETLCYYARYTEKELLPVMRKMAYHVTRAAEGKLIAIHTKYQSSKLMRVAARPELKPTHPIIQELANCPSDSPLRPSATSH